MSRTSRITVAALLPGAMAAGTVLYTVLSVLASFIIEDMGMSRAELGWVLTAYAGVSALTSPLIGWVTDRIGARAGMTVVFATGGVGFLLLAGAGTLWALIAAALVIGIGQTLSNPSTNKMIAHEYQIGGRGLITGIKQSGVQAAQFVGGVTFPALALAYGWRSVPVVVGATILGFMVAGLVGLPRHGRGRRGSAPLDRRELPPATRWIAGYAFLMGAGGSPVFAYLPLFATEAVGVSESTAGAVVGLAGLVGVVARIGWGVVAERRGEYAWPMLTIALIAVVAAVTIILSDAAGLTVLVIAAILAWMSISAWNTVAMLSVIVEAGPAAAGRASGIVLFGFLSGLAVSPPIFGWSVDRLGTYIPGFIVVTMLFFAASLTMLGWIRRSGAPLSISVEGR